MLRFFEIIERLFVDDRFHDFDWIWVKDEVLRGRNGGKLQIFEQCCRKHPKTSFTCDLGDQVVVIPNRRYFYFKKFSSSFALALGRSFLLIWVIS